MSLQRKLLCFLSASVPSALPIDFLLRFMFSAFALWTSTAAIELQETKGKCKIFSLTIKCKWRWIWKWQLLASNHGKNHKLKESKQNIYLSTRMYLPLFKIDQKTAIGTCISQKSTKDSSVITSDPECLFLLSSKWWFLPSVFCVLLFSRCIFTKLFLVDLNDSLIICFLLPFC